MQFSPRLGCPASPCQSGTDPVRCYLPTLEEGKCVTLRTPDSLQSRPVLMAWTWASIFTQIHHHTQNGPRLDGRPQLHRQAGDAVGTSCRPCPLRALLSKAGRVADWYPTRTMRRRGSLSDGTPMDCCPACMPTCQTPTLRSAQPVGCVDSEAPGHWNESMQV